MFPCYQFNFQLALDTYNAHITNTDGWNACRGGSPIKVIQAIAEGACILELTPDETVWLGHPTTMDSNSSFRMSFVTLDPIESLDRTVDKIQYRIFKYGPVVLGIDSLSLRDKGLSQRGGVIDGTSTADRDHAVTVVGWKKIKNVPCWIVRNSWGSNTVPTARPEAGCVGKDFNTCIVETQPWSGDKNRPGYAYIPCSYRGVCEPPSPWYDGIPTILSKHLKRDHAVEPLQVLDDMFTRARSQFSRKSAHSALLVERT
jgi:hypothetical protein